MSTLADVLLGRAQWCVLEADCLEVLPALPDASVAHVITDPPYEAEAHTQGRRIKPKTGKDNSKSKIVELQPLDFLPISEVERETSAREMARIARRWSMAFCQTEAAQRWARSFEAGGGKYKRTAIWVKPDGQPQLSGDRPGCGYESIVICHSPGRSRWNGGGRLGVFTYAKNVTGSREKNPHPTTKPTALMLELVELFTDLGETILDPFCGSGTTGVAAIRLGRRFIGIEKDAKYAAIARERLAAESQGLSLRDARAGQISLFGGAA